MAFFGKIKVGLNSPTKFDFYFSLQQLAMLRLAILCYAFHTRCGQGTYLHGCPFQFIVDKLGEVLAQSHGPGDHAEGSYYLH